MSCGCQKPTCCCSCGDREPPKAYVGDPSCSNDTCPKTKSPTVSAYVGDPSSCDSEACRPKIKIDEPKTIVDECGNCCPLKPCPCPCPKPEPCPCPKKKKNVCDPCDEPTWPRPVCDQCKPTCGMKEKECPQKDSCMGATWPRPNYDQCKPMTCPSRDKEQCRLREAAAKAKKQQDKNSSGCKIADAECPDAIVAKPDNISVLPFLGICKIFF